MAKMFYTIDEVAQKLGKSHDEIKDMAKSGQIQEFRDRDKLMFKVEQIDLLAGDDDADDSMSISLEDSKADSHGGGSGIALADSRLGASDSREGTGISVFDTDHGEDEPTGEIDSDQTHIGDTMDDELSLESVGSGSGLLDLTRESDDTALGAELLEEVYSGEENIEMPAGASGLFDATPEVESGAEAFGGGERAMPVMIEAYDGTGSGLAVGMSIGAMCALVIALIIAAVGVTGATPGAAMFFAGNLWMWVGILLGGTVVLGIIGLFIGKASE